MRVGRIGTLFLALALLVAPVAPWIDAARAEENRGGDPTGQSHDDSRTKDFVDKWVINGNAIGGAAGATLGQWLGTVMLPGPVGWVVGSMAGGLVGGILGNVIDNQIHNGYNYAAFDRPPMESGGLILKGVGPWEQGFYQVDQWVVNGGGIASLVAHFGVNLVGGFIPGPLGKFLQSYIGIFVFDAIFGTLGDNVDGMIDGGLIGRKIDEAKGLGPFADASTRGSFAGAPSGSSELAGAEKRAERDEAYRKYMALVKAGSERTAEAKAAFDRYRELSD